MKTLSNSQTQVIDLSIRSAAAQQQELQQRQQYIQRESFRIKDLLTSHARQSRDYNFHKVGTTSESLERGLPSNELSENNPSHCFVRKSSGMQPLDYEAYTLEDSGARTRVYGSVCVYFAGSVKTSMR